MFTVVKRGNRLYGRECECYIRPHARTPSWDHLCGAFVVRSTLSYSHPVSPGLSSHGTGAWSICVAGPSPGTAYYNARAKTATAEMNTDATAFEPMGRGDGHTGDDGDDEEDDTMLVAHHEDRRISFTVDSGAQSHNPQDLEASGLESDRTPTQPGSSSAHRPG